MLTLRGSLRRRYNDAQHPGGQGSVRIALAQFNPTIGDFEGNAARILELAGEAAQRGAQLAVFSELCVCGYPPLDLVERPAFLRRNRETLEALAGQASLPVIVGYVGGADAAEGKPAANCAALLAGGKLVFEQRKMLLPAYDVFDETRTFQPARKQFPVSLCGTSIGLTICEDIWNDKEFWRARIAGEAEKGKGNREKGGSFSNFQFPISSYERDPVAELVPKLGAGKRVLINISASPYSMGKRTLRVEMLRAMAVRYALPVVFVNQVGGNDSLVFDGSSVALTAGGEIAAQARAFEEDLVMFDTEAGAAPGELRAQPGSALEAVYRALVLGTRDYVRKCGFRKAVVGLSGGIDSAVVAAIAAEALGKENVLGVGMPGPYSSEGSLRDARRLAENLGIEFIVMPIHDAFRAYEQTLAPAFQGRSPDVTEENIQARIRGNLLMALSNKFGSLVLSTGNKSELAVGYCTLYGDMAGGLAVISDVPKTMVYELAGWINRGREVIPAETIAKPPSAELRPNQTDQDSLPPYDVLDRILKAYIEDLRSPEEIAASCGFPLELVESVAQMVARNEYKRKQAAPGIKVTSRAFGIGRRLPIAQKFSS
jgi:NAD+ synthase (glutamine-hydrolysing)